MLDIIDALVKGLITGMYMAISVGPTLFAVIRYSMHNSHKAGIAFVLGVSLSDALYVTLVNLAASFLEELRHYTRYIAWGGGILLIIVGIIGLIRKSAPVKNEEKIPVITGAHYAKIFFSGFLINTINPGVMLSWGGVIMLCAGQPIVYRFILFTTCLAFILSIDFLKVFLADRIKRSLTPTRLAAVQRISSIIIIVLGALLIAGTFLKILPFA